MRVLMIVSDTDESLEVGKEYDLSEDRAVELFKLHRAVPVVAVQETAQDAGLGKEVRVDVPGENPKGSARGRTNSSK